MVKGKQDELQRKQMCSKYFTQEFSYVVNNNYINDEIINRVSRVKDFAIIFQINIKFNDHYTRISNKA